MSSFPKADAAGLLAVKEAECRRLQHLIALQKSAIQTLEEALLYYTSPASWGNNEPGRGALAFLAEKKAQAQAILLPDRGHFDR
jgi:hypothetical protein